MATNLPRVTQLLLCRQFDFKAQFFIAMQIILPISFSLTMAFLLMHVAVNEQFMLNVVRLPLEAMMKDF